jgi:hypothetical protein
MYLLCGVMFFALRTLLAMALDGNADVTPGGVVTYVLLWPVSLLIWIGASTYFLWSLWRRE